MKDTLNKPSSNLILIAIDGHPSHVLGGGVEGGGWHVDRKPGFSQENPHFTSSGNHGISSGGFVEMLGEVMYFCCRQNAEESKKLHVYESKSYSRLFCDHTIFLLTISLISNFISFFHF